MCFIKVWVIHMRYTKKTRKIRKTPTWRRRTAAFFFAVTQKMKKLLGVTRHTTNSHPPGQRAQIRGPPTDAPSRPSGPSSAAGGTGARHTPWAMPGARAARAGRVAGAPPSPAGFAREAFGALGRGGGKMGVEGEDGPPRSRVGKGERHRI